MSFKYIDTCAKGGLPNWDDQLEYEPTTYPRSLLKKAARYLSTEDENWAMAVLHLVPCSKCSEYPDYLGCIYTDGEYIWSGLAVHHFLKHGLPLPADFLEKMKQLDYKFRNVSLEDRIACDEFLSKEMGHLSSNPLIMEEYAEYWNNLDRYALQHVVGSHKGLSNYCIVDLENDFMRIEILNHEIRLQVLKKMEDLGARKFQITWQTPMRKIIHLIRRMIGR